MGRSMAGVSMLPTDSMRSMGAAQVRRSWRTSCVNLPVLINQTHICSCQKLVHRQQRHCASSEWLVVRTPQRALPCTPPMHHAETTTTSMAH